MNAKKLIEARDRLEVLYWDCHRNGGPDLELLAILRLVEEAAEDADEPSEEDVCELAEQPEDEEIVILELDPPRPPAA